MIPWSLIDIAHIPGSEDELRLFQRGHEYSIRVERNELMSSREHFSEDALANLACDLVRERKKARVLIGGLGMGFTLAAALLRLKRDASVVVAELVSEVIRWNQETLGGFSGHPLRDKRVAVFNEDVGVVMRREPAGFDAIMLDVDNGPEGFTRESNNALYNAQGLATAYNALRPGGVLTVWSAKPSRAFVASLKRQKFKVETVDLRSRENGKGGYHTVWVATRA